MRKQRTAFFLLLPLLGFDLARKSREEVPARQFRCVDYGSAAFNLALYHEMKGDIAGALKQLKDVQDVFAGKYVSSGKDVPTEWHLLKVYEAELQQKDMIRQKLDLQMAR